MLASKTVLQNRYLIVKQLGQGGMGAVYEAVDQRLNSTVALKETLFTDERLRRQFEREAQLLARLRHPALTRVIDHFSESDGQFLVMDYIEGEDLSELLQRTAQPFALAQVLSWADQLLDALDYIHTQTQPVVHRDIKPQNLKLAGRGQIILLDFGLAKGSTGQQTTVTTTRSVLGYSLSYAPLEQLLQVETHWVEMLSVSNAPEVERMLRAGTDPRSDLYALSATLCHLLTGKAPMNAPTRALSVWAGRADPLIAGLSERVPHHIATVLARAMALSPDQRYATAAEMRHALRAANQPQSIPTLVSEATREALPPTVAAPQQPPSAPSLRAPQAPSPLPPTVAAPAHAQWSPPPARAVEIPFTPTPSLPPAAQSAGGTLEVPLYAYPLAVATGVVFYFLCELIMYVVLNELMH